MNNIDSRMKREIDKMMAKINCSSDPIKEAIAQGNEILRILNMPWYRRLFYYWFIKRNN